MKIPIMMTMNMTRNIMRRNTRTKNIKIRSIRIRNTRSIRIKVMTEKYSGRFQPLCDSLDHDLNKVGYSGWHQIHSSVDYPTFIYNKSTTS